MELSLAKLLFVGIPIVIGLTGVRSQRWQSFNRSEYYVANRSPQIFYTWHEARAFCMDNGGDLASIHSKSEHDWINTKLPSYRNAWIGLNKINQANWTWSDGTSVDFLKWSTNYPVVRIPSRDCVYIYSYTDNFINDVCADDVAFVCKRAPGSTIPVTAQPTPTVVGFCPTGYKGVGNKCFKVFYPTDTIEELTWGDALKFCREQPGLFPGLASIHNEQEQATILMQQKRIQGELWIGLYETGYYNWGWADNTAYDFQNWESRPGYSNCVVLQSHEGKEGKWKDVSCRFKRGYICQIHKDPNNVIPTPGPTPHSCKAGYQPYWYACYKLVTETKSWSEASESCTHEGADLVSIHHVSDNAAVYRMIMAVNQSVWIGFHDLNDTTRSGSYGWTNGWHTLYTGWGNNEPSMAPNGGCVLMASDGLWYDKPCSEKNPYMCKTTDAAPITIPAPVEGKCPEQDGWKEFGAYCYYFLTNRLPWNEAQHECLSMDSDAQLASVHSLVENEFIFDSFNNPREEDVWIGMHRAQTHGNFEWLDGTPVEYVNWAPGEPARGDDTSTDHCIVILGDGFKKMWSDRTCSPYKYAVCKTPKKPPLTPLPDVPGVCPDDTWYKLGRSCYLFVPNAYYSWEMGQEECAQRGGFNSSLVTFDDEYEDQYVYQTMIESHTIPAHRYYWIGLTRKTADDPMVLITTGSEPEYTNWGRYDPSIYGIELCAAVNMEDGNWESKKCKDYGGFACKTPLIPGDAIPIPMGITGGVSTGGIAGIVIAILVLGVLGAAAAFYFLIYRPKRVGKPVLRLSPEQGFTNPTAVIDSSIQYRSGVTPADEYDA